MVFLGGGLGAAARYGLSGAVYRWTGSAFPYGTMIVNVLGCAAIGFLMTSFDERFIAAPALRIFLTIGILGGFTTFSTFSFETIRLLMDGEMFYATVNVGITVFTCLAATYFGTALGRFI